MGDLSSIDYSAVENPSMVLEMVDLEAVKNPAPAERIVYLKTFK